MLNSSLTIVRGAARAALRARPTPTRTLSVTPPCFVKQSLDWADPLELTTLLTDEEKLIAETAKSYAQSKLMPRVLLANRHERFDRSIMTELGELGLLGGEPPQIKGWTNLSPVHVPSPLQRPSTATAAQA